MINLDLLLDVTAQAGSSGSAAGRRIGLISKEPLNRRYPLTNETLQPRRGCLQLGKDFCKGSNSTNSTISLSKPPLTSDRIFSCLAYL